MIKILLIHNYYKKKGGEDLVFESEFNLLKKHAYSVDKLIYDNSKELKTFKDKLKIGLLGIYNPKSAKQIEEKIKNFKPDIIHVHNFFPIASLSIFFIAKKYKIPVVMTLHNFRLICPNALLFRNGQVCEECIDKIFPCPGIINKCYRGSLLQTFSLASIISIHKILKTWYKKIDRFITLTEFQKNKFLSSSLGISEEKFVVKPNFSEDFGEGQEKRENFFLYVGRLSEEKGIKTLLKAFENANIKLKIVGDGSLKKEVIKYSKKYPNIEYVGYKEKKEIISLMKKTRAVIFPSECYETFGLVIIEAFSTGTPVISSNIGNHASLVKNGHTGIHFEVGNYIDLRRKIKEFLNIKNKKFYMNARKEYLDKYTPEKNLSILLNIYKEVIYASQKKNN